MIQYQRLVLKVITIKDNIGCAEKEVTKHYIYYYISDIKLNYYSTIISTILSEYIVTTIYGCYYSIAFLIVSLSGSLVCISPCL